MNKPLREAIALALKLAREQIQEENVERPDPNMNEEMIEHFARELVEEHLAGIPEGVAL